MTNDKVEKFSSKVWFVIETNPGEYLTWHGGDWGPDHHSDRDITKAVMNFTAKDAMQYALKHWTEDRSCFKIKKILVEKTVVVKFLT